MQDNQSRYEVNLMSHKKIIRNSKNLKIRNLEEFLTVYISCNKKSFCSLTFDLILGGNYTYSGLFKSITLFKEGRLDFASYSIGMRTRNVGSKSIIYRLSSKTRHSSKWSSSLDSIFRNSQDQLPKLDYLKHRN